MNGKLYNYDNVCELIYLACLPADFDQWELADKDGWTVAHDVARFGHLPADFDQIG